MMKRYLVHFVSGSRFYVNFDEEKDGRLPYLLRGNLVPIPVVVDGLQAWLMPAAVTLVVEADDADRP